MLKWVLILGGGFVLILLLMRRNEGGPTSGILGNSRTNQGGGNLFDEIGSYVTSIKRLFGGSGSNSGRTGSELEKEDGSIDLSHIYG